MTFPDALPECGTYTRGMPDSVWRLLDGDIEVARLVVTEPDFPWVHARLEPTEAYAAVRPLFDEDLRLSDRFDEDPAAADEAYYRIRERLTLVDPDGRVVPEWLLHVDGDQAWWRWNDEPFDPE